MKRETETLTENSGMWREKKNVQVSEMRVDGPELPNIEAFFSVTPKVSSCDTLLIDRN